MQAQTHPAFFAAVGMPAHRYRSLRSQGRVGDDGSGFTDSSVLNPDLGVSDAVAAVTAAANAAMAQVSPGGGGGPAPAPAPLASPAPVAAAPGMATWKKAAIGAAVVAAGVVIVDPKILKKL